MKFYLAEALTKQAEKMLTGSSRIKSLRDFQSGGGDDDDDDEPMEYFTGGEKRCACLSV
jgi:hypothetical protein